MFVDASAIVAILTGEAEREELGSRLDDDRSPMTSPLAIFEAVAAIVRKAKLSVDHAEAIVLSFLQEAGIAVLPIDEETAQAALRAFDRYGKGRHRAQLNLGDCFAYAMARRHGARLLYKGDDFSQTDLA